MSNLKALFLCGSVSLMSSACIAEPGSTAINIGKGPVADVYANNCASCHGKNMEGGVGGSLLDDNWTFGGSNSDITHTISMGREQAGMPGFGEALGEDVVRSLVIYIAETREKTKSETVSESKFDSSQTFSSDLADFTLEEVLSIDETLWAFDFLPEGRMLLTDKSGPIYLVDADGDIQNLEGVPESWDHGQGGMLDIKLDTDYAQSGWIYFTFSEKRKNSDGEDVGMTKLIRAKLNGTKLVDQETLWEAKLEHLNSRQHHFGSRIEIIDDFVFFSIGDRGVQDQAQDLTRPNGKIHRVHKDGRIPKDNPFIDVEGAYSSIWSYGHRNPQGMTIGEHDGKLYAIEHGPRGGDEFNRPEKGKNYGWPVITYGMNYNGTPMTSLTAKEGMEQPLLYWTPSIATGGLAAFSGSSIPEWKNDFFAGGLATQRLIRLRIEDGDLVSQEMLLDGVGRVRDILEGPDGHLYFLINKKGSSESTIYKVVSAQEKPE